MSKTLEKIKTLEGKLFFAGIAVIFVYILGVLLLSVLSGVEFNDVILYKYTPVNYKLPHLVSFLIKPLTVISSFLLITIFPGVLFALFWVKNKLSFGLVRLFLLGFIFNIMFLFFGTTLLKLLGIVINRGWFVLLILTLTLTTLILAFVKKIFCTRHSFIKHKKTFICFAILTFVVTLFTVSFQINILRPLPVKFDYSEQAVIDKGAMNIGARQIEMGVAHHLKSTILPHWLIEYLGEFGVYLWTPPLPYYIDFFNIILLGESYAAFSLLFLFFAALVFLFVYKIIRIPNFCKKESILLYFGPALFLCGFLWLYMLPGRRIDISFLEWPTCNFFNTLQGVWIFFMMGIVFFLLKKDLTFSFLLAILASLSRYETIPMVFVLILLKYFFDKDKDFSKVFVKRYVIFLSIYIIYILIVILSHERGLHYLRSLAFDKIFIRLGWLRDRFSLPTTHQKIWGHLNAYNTNLFIKATALSTFFFFFLFLFPTSDRIIGFCSIFGIIYFIAVSFQEHKLFSYAGLLIPLASINIRRFVCPDTRQQHLTVLAYFIILCFSVYCFLVLSPYDLWAGY